VDGRGTVWFPFARNRFFGPPTVEGYRPGTRAQRALALPQAGAVDDLELSPDGELVVLVGSRLARGRVGVPPVSFPSFDRIHFWFFVLILLMLFRRFFPERWKRSCPAPRPIASNR
jgi:hypothetical protein